MKSDYDYQFPWRPIFEVYASRVGWAAPVWRISPVGGRDCRVSPSIG